MICGMEIGMFIAGVMALIKGRMTISKTRAVEGVPARLLGLIAMTPLPIVLLVGVVIGVIQGDNAQALLANNNLAMILTEAGIVIGIAVLVFGVGFALSTDVSDTPKKKKKTRRVVDTDYGEDVGSEEEERPRRRRRVQSDDEEF